MMKVNEANPSLPDRASPEKTANPSGDEVGNVTIVKCRCGDPVCKCYGLSDGLFPQGAGWDEGRAREYATAVNFYAANIARIVELEAALSDALDDFRSLSKGCSDKISRMKAGAAYQKVRAALSTAEPKGQTK